jgi:hypothetical protein
MNDRELIAGLDACRAGSDDLRQPELGPVARRVADDPRAEEIRVRLVRIDAEVMRAMHEAAPPPGLEERLIARLQEAARESAIGDLAGPDVSDAPPATLRRGLDPQLSRRRWLAWSGGLAIAAGAVIAAFFLTRENDLTSDDLLAADQWHEAIADFEGWQTLSHAELAEHPLPTELRHLPSRYRDSSDTIGREAVAYDLSLPGRPRATLFVIQQATPIAAPGTAPSHPQSNTQGYCIAYWQRGETIYVVAIESDRLEDYRTLIKTSIQLAARI